MSNQDTMLQNEEALKTGGPARSQQRVIFVSDTLCMTSASCFNSSSASHVHAGVIAVIGDIVEGPMRKKVVALWVSWEGFVAPARHDGRLHIQDASHILELETSDGNEKFSSISALKCPTPPGDDDSGAEQCDIDMDGGNDAAGGSITIVVIACSQCAIYRWTLQLDRSAAPASQQLEVTVADVGRYLQRQRPWRNVPAPLVLHAVHVLQEAVQTQGYGTVCTIGDCNETENISAWSVAVVLSATIEGSDVIIRDNQLSVVCMISASSYASLPEPSLASPTSSPNRGKAVPGPVHGAPTHVIVTCVNSRAFCFISYENGPFSVWDVEPCVRISDADLANEELDLSSLKPILLFDTRFAYEISVFSVLQSVIMNQDTARASRGAGAGAKSGSACGMVTIPVLVGSRDGRLRKLQLERSNSSNAIGVSGNVNVKEVYNIDLAKETRYLEAAMQKNSISGQGTLPNDTPAQVKHNFSCIPLALAPLPGSGSGTDAINAGICQAVTTRAILTLRLCDLKILKSVALSSLGEMSGGVATKALSDAAVSSYASLFVSAFDKQVRVYYLAVSFDRATTTTARVAGSRPLMKRPSADAAPATASAVARTKAAAGDSMSANDTHVSTLSFFLTAADMSVINGPDAADDKDEAVGFSLGRGGGNDGTEKCIRISPLAAPNNVPPPTPVALRGAAAKGTSPSKNPNSWETPGKDKSGKILNQPVTFHARIKSSGYGQSPQGALEKLEKKRKDKNLALARERQKDTLSRSVTAPARNRGAATASAGTSSAPRLRRYPTECAAITVHQAHNEFTAASMAGPLHRVTFNGDGSAFGVATSDSTVSVLKAPISRYGGDGSFYMSHNADITNVQFSHQRVGDKQLVLSSSADGTARVWRAGKVDYSAVCFTHDKSSTGSSHITTTTATSSRNRPYSGAIIDASFYYNDRFVSLANGNRAFIYTYSCDGTDAKNDLKRLQSNGSYRRVHKWSFSDAKSVTALANINSVLSPLLLSATSDRKLHVLDAARGAVVRSIEASHERAIHCIALPQPSVYAQLDASSYNLFATAAMDNCIVIWDIRSPSVAGRFTGHVNRREHVRCALSPCLRYLACGSEDKAARLVDLRTVTEVTRYTGHRDVVSDAAFHPISAQLATSSYDGSVKFYCSSDAN